MNRPEGVHQHHKNNPVQDPIKYMLSPCYQIHSGPTGDFLTSLQHDAEQFSIYIGGGTPSATILPNHLTSALHLEMKLWPLGRLKWPYNINAKCLNSWKAMANRTTCGSRRFTNIFRRAEVFGSIALPPRKCHCALNEYDLWILKLIDDVRTLGLANAGIAAWIPASAKDKPPELTTSGLAQKLINIFTKYEFCWQQAGSWNGRVFVPYRYRFMPGLSQFLCALHAPIDAILIKALLKLPVGRWLRANGYIDQNSIRLIQADGQPRSWSKLDCLRTYYGFQLVLRRIAMATWPTRCACSKSAHQAIQDGGKCFNDTYGSGVPLEKDWIAAACDIPEWVIEETLKKLGATEGIQSTTLLSRE